MSFKQVTVPFKNRGIVQKLSPDLAQPDQFYALENFDSDAEGSLVSVRGCKDAGFGTLPNGSFAHSLTRFRPSALASEQRYYVGDRTLIHRARGDGLGGYSVVYTSPESSDRFFTALNFDPGVSGKPYMFFAHQDAMLKDTGNLATLQRWGILAPSLPASAVAVASSTIGVFSGTLSLVMAAAGWGDQTSTLGSAVNLSRGGRYEQAYDSEDPIHVSIALESPELIEDIRLQLDVSVVPGTFTDYYEKAIVPSGLADYVARLQTAREAYQARIDAINRGEYSSSSGYYKDYSSGYNPAEELARQLEAVEIETGGGLSEDIYIRKDSFMRFGAAGATRDWRHVCAIKLVAKTKGAATITISTIELQGGEGPNSEAGGRTKYRYRYTYRNPLTGVESNPSVPTVEAKWTAASRQALQVTAVSSTDSQVSGAGSIAYYRAGGALGDGLYRFVGYATNGAYPGTVTFSDTVTDDELAKARILAEDNDPPVLSTLPQSFIATMDAARAETAWGLAALSVTVQQPAGATAEDVLRPGSTVFINGEPVIVQSVSGNTVTCAPQRGYAAGAQMRCDSVAGQPCELACTAFESVFLAGDANNPHVLYQSKRARPEAFPIVNLVNGVTHQVKVSNPSNPIMGIADFGDRIVCLCLASIYHVPLWNGTMRSPEESASQRGVIGKRAWCKAPDGSIWFLSYDGVYSWSGGRAQLRSYSINGLFNGQELNGYKPLDLTASNLPYVVFTAADNCIRIACRDTGGADMELIFDLIEERWYIRRPAPHSADWLRTTAYLPEPDTGRLLVVRASLLRGIQASAVYEYDVTDGADPWDGVVAIAHMPFFTGGEPALQKLLGDIVVDLENPVPVTVKVFYDYNLSAPAETFTIPAGPGRRWSYPLPIGITDSKTGGKEFRAVSLRFEVTTKQRVRLHSVTYSIAPLAYIQRGRVMDWTTLGWAHDKRLEQLHLVYDTKGQEVTLHLDTVSGIAGNIETDSVATFKISGAGRSNVTLPIKDAATGQPIVAKLVRLRTQTPVADPIIMLEEPRFIFEQYPPDIVYHTPLTDSGYQFLKYYQQIVLDVDTGGVPASVTLEVDGYDKQTVMVLTTPGDRRRSLTLNPDILGRLARLRISPGVGGKFQLFSDPKGLFVVAPADKGAVVHTWDWDDLGHPWDKKLSTVTVEYEVTADTLIQVDRIYGLSGAANPIGFVMNIPLKAGGRRKENFPVPGAPIAKAVRLHPTATNVDFKYWKYIFDKTDYPADTIPETPPDDCGYPWEKILRSITLSVDTGGVPATCALLADGVQKFTFTVTATDADRAEIVTAPYDVIGKIFKIVPTPGPGGKFQLFKPPLYSVVPEPPPLTKWSSYELVLGYDGIKTIKQLWVEYMCTAGIRVVIYVDGGKLFYTKDLPAHAFRNVERFFVPVINAGVLNKSKVYRFHVESLDPSVTFKLYRDGTRVNSKPLNADQRAGYLQHQLWETMATNPA